MPEVCIEARDVIERKADSKGRVRCGPEFADQRVEVAVIRVLDDEETDGEASN